MTFSVHALLYMILEIALGAILLNLVLGFVNNELARRVIVALAGIVLIIILCTGFGIIGSHGDLVVK